MVAARERFLARGHYASVAELLADCAAEALVPWQGRARCILEVGAGTGYYLSRIVERTRSAPGIALDISKFAARRAARAHPRIGAIVADAEKRVPVQTGSAAILVSIFAPRNALEFQRVLAPDGTLLVATPTSRHLEELIAPLELIQVDPRKQQRLSARLTPWFAPITDHGLESALHLSREDVFDLVAMGPNAFHVQHRELRRRIGRLPEHTRVTASFSVSVFRRV